MKLKLHLSLLLLISIVWSLSFQSCTSPVTSETSEEEASTSTEETAGTTTKGGTEMSIEEQAVYAVKHQEDLIYIHEKIEEINNEHSHKKDQFNFECASGTIALERIYNDNDDIHLMSYHLCGDDGCSTKHYYFWETKLIYQFHHHETVEGGKQVVDDHKTYFKDGKIVRCLEKRISYVKGEAHSEDLMINTPYEQVDCVPADKLTKDIEKLLALSKEEAKDYLCK